MMSGGVHGISTIVNITNEQMEIAQSIYLEAGKMGVSPKKMILLADCESNLNQRARGDFRSETGEYMAMGVFQWWQGSWDFYTKKYKLDLDRESVKDQITLTALVLKNGGAKNWVNCSRKVGFLPSLAER